MCQSHRLAASISRQTRCNSNLFHEVNYFLSVGYGRFPLTPETSSRALPSAKRNRHQPPVIATILDLRNAISR